MKYLVEIYEPAVDPGGYQEVIEVDTCCEHHAKHKALDIANKKYARNYGLVVSSVITKKAAQFLNACKIR